VDWKEKNVLITGATGFVGSWLAQNLIDKGSNVIALVRDDLPKSALNFMGVYPKLKAVVNGDISDFGLVKRVFNEYEINCCFHLAAQTIVGVANESPMPTFETNIKGSWNMLEAARMSKTLERIVIASTDKVYGEPMKVPITEDHPLLASYPYDVSKACVDMLSHMYFSTYGLPIGITRCSNIYGGGDLNFSRIVPGTVKSVIFNESPIIRSDGTPIRDYIYVLDAVNAYIVLAENLDKNGVKGNAFNFGAAVPIRVLDLVNKIIQISGKNLKPTILGQGKMKAEIDAQYLSSKKSESLLGWKPRISIEEGLKKTIEWYNNFFKTYRESS
jgi:CDP-glucose 4,6-dehydratase